jgi:hypothetical protein
MSSWFDAHVTKQLRHLPPVLTYGTYLAVRNGTVNRCRFSFLEQINTIVNKPVE